MLRPFPLFRQSLSVLLLFLSVSYSFSQKDTVRIFQYNLLNYGNSANQPSIKNPKLKTILDQVKPDIFGANEIANSASHSLNILNNVLDTNWARGTFVNTGNETQTNMLFWNKKKFGLKKQQTVSHNLRDIIAFHLFYKDSNLAITNDTIFLVVIVAHLKASDGTAEAAARAAETQTVVSYLNTLGEGNYIFMGDLNLYTSSEVAYQNLIASANPNSKLYDPINRPGTWNNTSFSDIHTQSTRATSLPDGGVTGGMDDRFDFILCSGSIMGDSSGMQYLPASYQVLGQDGLHYNKALNDGTNNAAPANVITALYEMSDHLPVYADFIFTPEIPVVGISKNQRSFDNLVSVVNPFDDKLTLYFKEELLSQKITVSLFSFDGKKIFSKNMKTEKNEVGNTKYEISLQHSLQPGLYIMTLTNEEGVTITKKLIKN
jgi:hypothetical protein